MHKYDIDEISARKCVLFDRKMIHQGTLSWSIDHGMFSPVSRHVLKCSLTSQMESRTVFSDITDRLMICVLWHHRWSHDQYVEIFVSFWHHKQGSKLCSLRSQMQSWTVFFDITDGVMNCVLWHHNHTHDQYVEIFFSLWHHKQGSKLCSLTSQMESWTVFSDITDGVMNCVLWHHRWSHDQYVETFFSFWHHK